jgi:hypothetical protein
MVSAASVEIVLHRAFERDVHQRRYGELVGRVGLEVRDHHVAPPAVTA